MLCNQENLSIPSSATDPNGDSLHYVLCSPLHGGGKDNGSGFNSPVPNPPAPPPYAPIGFLNPATASNPIPGNPSLSIDGATGMLTGRLTVTGQFVLTICVEEWRNGALLNTIRRDYQFNVTSCQANIVAKIVSEIDDPTQICIGATVPFRHQSINASKKTATMPPSSIGTLATPAAATIPRGWRSQPLPLATPAPFG